MKSATGHGNKWQFAKKDMYTGNNSGADFIRFACEKKTQFEMACQGEKKKRVA